MEKILKHYNVQSFDEINFTENKKYIFFEELKNRSGNRYNNIKKNNDSIDNYSSHSPSCTNLYNVLK